MAEPLIPPHAFVPGRGTLCNALVPDRSTATSTGGFGCHLPEGHPLHVGHHDVCRCGHTGKAHEARGCVACRCFRFRMRSRPRG